MEKISGEDLVEMTNAVNELIDRLKTLEDKVEFIMENSHYVIAPIKIKDPWEEQNECQCVDCQCKRKLDNGFTGSNTEPTDKEYVFEMDKPRPASYYSGKPRIIKCIKGAGYKSGFEIGCMNESMAKEMIDLLNSLYPTDKSEKIEEIIKKLNEYGEKCNWDWTWHCDSLESWLRDKLKSL